MKALIILCVFVAGFGSKASRGDSIVDRCYNAALATDYVYTDRYVVQVDTDSIDQFQTEVAWVEIHKPHFQVLVTPSAYQSGGYVFRKGVQTFVIKGDLSVADLVDQSLYILNDLPAVRVDCKYRL